jgi:hypothetical protein
MPISMPYTPNPTSIESNRSVGRRGMAMLWQVVDFRMQPLFPTLLAMHVNPSSWDESFSKSKTVVQTYGGYVEYLWQDELDGISATSSTGAFLNPNVGLTAGSDIEKNVIPFSGADSKGKVGRQNSMAWERQEDLLDVFRNNGNIYDGNGIPRLRGRVRCIYDRGIYTGHFESFTVKEVDDKAFVFELSWEFKVEKVQYVFPDSGVANRVAV